MPRHSKTKGKERLDKYYKLAKEQGLRARSAFKLAQLNKKFGFLQNARVVIDLGAAPGGWLQICQKTMSMSSTILGVDLVPIRPIPGVKTFVADLMSEKCRKDLKTELHSRKVDVVLHDGAPNVSGAWDKDAYVQNVLCLHSLRLACELLEKDGVFVTKIFRAQDYNKLLFVLTQLFTKCHATKPESSRYTSAEIYVVCIGFKAPKSIDPAFFNPRSVFAELKDDKVEDSQRAKEIMMKKQHKEGEVAKKIKAVGYEGNSMLLFKKMSATDFINSTDALGDVQKHSEITFDETEDRFKDSQYSTDLVMDACKDLKQCNLFCLRKLLKWQKQVFQEELARQALDRGSNNNNISGMSIEGMENYNNNGATSVQEIKLKHDPFQGDIDDRDKDITQLEAELSEIDALKERIRRKHAKRVVERKLKTATRANFNPADGENFLDDLGAEVYDGDSDEMPDITADDYDENWDVAQYHITKRLKEDNPLRPKQYGEGDMEHDSDEASDNDEDDQEEESNDDQEEKDSDDEEEDNTADIREDPDYDERVGSRKKDLDFFGRCEEVLQSHVKKQNRNKFNEELRRNNEQPIKAEDDDDDEEPNVFQQNDKAMDSDESDSQSEEEEDEDEDEDHSDEDKKYLGKIKSKSGGAIGGSPGVKLADNKVAKTGFEQTPACLREPDSRAKIHALAVHMLDKRSKRDLLESGVHRWCFNDDNLPSWFVEDEKASYFRTMPVTKDEMETQKARFKELNARPAKKILEAIYRKRMKAKKILHRILDKEKDAAQVDKKKSPIPSVRQLMRSQSLNKGKKKKAPIDNKMRGERRRQYQATKQAKKKGGIGRHSKSKGLAHKKSAGTKAGGCKKPQRSGKKYGKRKG